LGHFSDTFVLALIPFTVAIKSHAQFCIQVSNQCNKLECSPGVQKEGQFPALHHQKKTRHPSLLIFHFFKQNISSLHINLRSSILFQTKKTLLQFLFFWVVGTLGLWGGGEGFVVVTSCCKRKFSLELLI